MGVFNFLRHHHLIFFGIFHVFSATGAVKTIATQFEKFPGVQGQILHKNTGPQRATIPSTPSHFGGHPFCRCISITGGQNVCQKSVNSAAKNNMHYTAIFGPRTTRIPSTYRVLIDMVPFSQPKTQPKTQRCWTWRDISTNLKVTSFIWMLRCLLHHSHLYYLFQEIRDDLQHPCDFGWYSIL